MRHNRTKKSSAAKWIAAGAAATTCGFPTIGETAPSDGSTLKPNIVYFISHDIGRMISPYGARVHTPNLETFAADGALLMHAHCSSPACSPSRGCAMTGRYAHKTGLVGVNDLGASTMWELKPDEKTIVNYLNEAGYLTAHSGFQHERHSGFDRQSLEAHGDPNGYQVRIGPREWKSSFVENAIGNAIDWLKERDPAEDRPFYLNIGTQEAHMSVFDGELGRKYGRPDVYGTDDPEQVWIPETFPDNRESRDYLSKFIPVVRHIDREFGRLVAAIDELGYGDNTIIVFTTDHGVCGPRHKGRLFEVGTEISCIVRFPGKIPDGLRADALIGNIDFCPTLLEAAGVPVPEKVDGRSFWPLLIGGAYTPNQAIFLERNYHLKYDPMRAVRTKDFMYIRNFHPKAKYFYTPAETLALPPPFCDRWANNPVEDAVPFDDPSMKNRPDRPREQLYDLRKDPYEFKNVSNHPEYRSILTRMAAQLDRWMTEEGDALLQGKVQYGVGTLE